MTGCGPVSDCFLPENAYTFPGIMGYPEDEESSDFEWVDEDENEVPEDRGKTLSSLHPIAAWVLGGLAGLFILYLIMRAALALSDYFG